MIVAERLTSGDDHRLWAVTITDPTDPASLYAPHGRPGAYFNPWGSAERGFGDLLRWVLTTRREDRKAPLEVPVLPNDGAYLGRAGEPPSVTWIGHASVAVQDGSSVCLADPHFGARALVPVRKTPPGIPLSAIPPDAFAVLSHNHYDHLDSWTVAHLPRTLRWFVPLGLQGWFRKRGIEAVELDWWNSVRHDHWTLTCLPAQHWSNRFGVKRNGSLWCSWLLDSGARRYYFGGDSGYFHGFAEIGRRFAPIDVAVLPIGAYEPRWFMAPQHMNPEDAVRAFRDLGARIMVPIHWGTFDLTNERVDRAPRDLTVALTTAKIDLAVARPLAVGERRFLNP
jgi:N-acyl-phosphatidylethanolamine-hydrolysing phospholipase D